MAIKRFSKKNESIIGVDLGSAIIKIVELKKENNKPRLITYGLATKEKHEVSSDTAINKEMIISDLKQTISMARVTTKKAIGALPAISVFSAIIELPQMPVKEINSAIRWEAKKIVPLPLEKMNLNWHILPDTTTPKNSDSQQKTIKIIINAAPKDIINSYLEIFQAADLNLISLETEIKALQRSLLSVEEKTCLIIDIGATNTNMIVFDNNLPLINKNIDIGGETVNFNIANILSIDVERAEHLKNNFGLPADDQITHPVIKAIKFTIDNMIVQEIKHLTTVLQNSTEAEINKIIITGGGSHLKNFPIYLHNVLQIETIRGNSWQKIVYPQELAPELNKIGPEMSVAVGLALKGIS